MGLPNFGLEPMLVEGGRNPGGKISPIGFVIDVLKLASAALGEMAAWRLLVMGTADEHTVVGNRIARYAERDMLAARGHAIAARCDADDLLSHRAA